MTQPGGDITAILTGCHIKTLVYDAGQPIVMVERLRWVAGSKATFTGHQARPPMRPDASATVTKPPVADVNSAVAA